MMKRSNHKNTKKKNVNKVSSETNLEKVCSLKKENRRILKRITIINFLYIIAAVLFSIPIEFRISEMITEISRVSHNLVILMLCMFAYYAVTLLFYVVSTYPIILSLKEKISHNNKMIKNIKISDHQKMNEVMSKVNADKLFKEISDI